jgi:N6-L-threonylcarbamoyladenine synthase
MHVLGIETSCDETAVALVKAGKSGMQVVDSLVSSQVQLHAAYGGVVPEIAVREHLRNLPALVPELLRRTNFTWQQIDALAVTEGPGLASSLLIGNAYARALALSLSKPLFGINHLEGHLFSPFLSAGKEVVFPFIGLVVSGGHTLLVHVLGWDRYVKLGGTVDDAAGEVFDKVARLLGLPYPGGPEIEKRALEGNPNAYAFPRSFPEKGNYQFSFSGLKTSVRYFFEKNPGAHGDPQWQADLCASFQESVVQVLVRKTLNAAEARRSRTVAAAGGVLCNQRLRSVLEAGCAERGYELLLADAGLCTDNAAMIAAVAAEKMRHGLPPQTSPDIQPSMGLQLIQPGGEVARGLDLAGKLKKRQTRGLAQKSGIR